jgi:hypothetical protein
VAKHKRMMTGDCGEFYVASMLAGMYSDVKVERMNEKAKDLKVTIGRQKFTIQVKSGRKYTNDVRKKIPNNSRWVWQAGKKCIGITNPHHWYAFVYLGEWPKAGEPPKIFFIPSRTVSRELRTWPGQEDWFAMYQHKAEKFCGVTGFRSMMKAFRETSRR